LTLDHAHLHAAAQWDLESGAGDLAVTHGGVTVAHEQHGAGDVDGKINRVAHAGFGRIHVAAESFRDHRATCLAAGRGDTDTAEERMQRERYSKLRIERVKCGGIGGVIDRVEPDLFGYRWVEHGRVIGGVDGAKSGSQRANALVAVDLKLKNLHRQR